MKKFLLIYLMFLSCFTVFGQANDDWNPFLAQAIIDPAPLAPVELNGVGIASFFVGNTGSSDLPLMVGDTIRVVITLSNGVPNNANPLLAMSGGGLSYFNWSYNPGTLTYTGLQNQTLPGNMLEEIFIAYRVTDNTPLSNALNGFIVTLTPPVYTDGINAIDDDEVSSYTYVRATDFGDAPISYGSASADINFFKDQFGQYELLMMLGDTIDSEDTYLPSVLADGDDNSGLSDEDGVVFPLLLRGSNVNIEVSIKVYGGTGFLNGWIDWNQNGSFDVGEEVAVNLPFNSTTVHMLNVTIPANATLGSTYARFRFGEPAGPDGFASYGEVEDYQVIIADCRDLACFNEINYSLDGECEGEITADMLLTTPTDGIPFYVIVKDSKGNIIPGNIVNKSHVGMRLKVEVYEPEFCGRNSCWGYINIEDKLGPKLEVPQDTMIYCVESTLPARTGEATAEDCEGDPKVGYRDTVEDFKCEGDDQVIKRITRTWWAIDASGNIVSGVQIIEVKSLSSDSIKNPIANIELVCGDDFTPEGIRAKLGIASAYPYVVSPVDGSLIPILRGSTCHFAAEYVDQPIFEEACQPNCKSTQKRLRTWTVLNWCEGTVTKYLQVIKLLDKVGPEIDVTSPTQKYSVNAWGCDVDITLPTATVTDSCDPDAQIVHIDGPLGVSVVKRGNAWVALKVPYGTHTFTYTASDCCGNLGTASITLSVEDRVAPVATAKEFITVSLVRSGDDSIVGVAKLFVDQVNNGSYDNCTGVYMEVRREDDSPACLNEGTNGYNNNRTYNGTVNGLDQTNPIHTNDNTLDTDKGQFVKFCCEDIGQEVKVYLRVWDDASKDGIYGNAGDNYNETWSMVKVEDKSVPKISCVADVSIDCDRDLTDFNFTSAWISTQGKVPASMLPSVEGICGQYEFEYRDAGSLNTCNQGVITRTYRVKGHISVTCSIRITVEDVDSDPRLEWPVSLHNWNSCVLTEADVLENTIRARVNVDRESGDRGCYDKISVRSHETTGCGTDQLNLSCSGEAHNLAYTVSTTGCNNRPAPQSTNGMTTEGLPRFNPSYKDPGCNIYGRQIKIEEYNVGEGCKKWLVRFEYINWCCNEISACRETIYKYEDTTPPVIVECPGENTDILDGDCLAPIVLSPVATDAGGCAEGLTWRIRIYPNKGLAFTEYRTINGLTGGAGLRGNNPTFTHPTGLPPGVHGVKYIVTDGCGNVVECDSEIAVWPKPATPYCVSISSAVMKNGLVELWARDFDNGSFTNCGTGALLFTFNRNGQAEHPVVSRLKREHFFKGFGQLATEAEYNAGNAQKWLPNITITQQQNQTPDTTLLGGSSGKQFGCAIGDALGEPIVVEMRAWDLRSFKAGTIDGSDFCSTRLTLIDNQGGCGDGSLVSLGGSIQTEEVEMMGGVEVQLKSNLPEYPIATKTDKDGKYTFGTLPIGVDYTIQPTKTDDYLNGVNTLDLVQIQRHILGVKKLDNPYKMIAADADGDESIRVNDIVTLRKLILGITDKIEEVGSWRFVDASDRMENGPWPFREVISHATLGEERMGNNFIGVKIGDVDGSAGANAVNRSTEPRSVGVQLIAEERAVQAGEEVEISLTAAQFTEVHGMQMTLRHEGLEFTRVEGRAIELTSEHVGKVTESMTTLSWASLRGTTIAEGSEVMRLSFRATKAMKLSEVLRITSDVTSAEAYVGVEMERSGVVLEVRSKESRPFEIAQNEPNPWKTATMIKFDLPEAGDVKLTILDVTGRIIQTYDSKGEAGQNEVMITREQLGGASGVMIYKVESGKYSAQRKMLVIE
jgi:hypothetical protein